MSLAMARMRQWLQITGFQRKPLHTVFLVVGWGSRFNYFKEERGGGVAGLQSIDQFSFCEVCDKVFWYLFLCVFKDRMVESCYCWYV
jgi:hypothetical protein